MIIEFHETTSLFGISSNRFRAASIKRETTDLGITGNNIISGGGKEFEMNLVGKLKVS